jgi:hypothetical protein
MNKFIKYFALLVFVINLIGCATNSVSDINQRLDESKKIESLLFNQMPLPKDAKIAPENSMILGEGDNWAGRIEITSGMTILEASTYFTSEYPKFNWTLISSTKSKTAILVFTNPTRTLTIEINDKSGLSSKTLIYMTVAPRIMNQQLPDSKRP